MTEKLDTFKACRTCATFYLSTSEYLKPMYSADFETPEILEIRNEIKIWNIGIFEDDGFPQDICTMCIAQFIKLLSFRNSCYNAQVQLQRIYRRDIKPINDSEVYEYKKIKNEIKSEPEDYDDDDSSDMVIFDELSDEEGGIKNFKPFSYVPIKKEELDDEIEANENGSYSASINELNNSEQIQTNEQIENNCGTISALKESLSEVNDERNVEVPPVADIKAEPNEIKTVLESSLADAGLLMFCKYCIYHRDDSSVKINFPSSTLLQEHISLSHPEDKPYRCTYCLKLFYSVNNCRVHIKYEHSEVFIKKESTVTTRQQKRAKGMNQESRKKLNTNNVLNRRVLRNSSNEYAKCTECDYVCRSRLKLKAHLLEVHEIRDEPNICKVCGKTFQSEEEREEHVWSEHADMAKKQLKNPKLLKDKKNVTDLNVMETDDPDNIPSCSNFKLYNNISSNNGLETETTYANNDPNGTLYSCAKCPATFPTQRHLLLHHKTEHNSNIPDYNCDICGKNFELKFSLNQHKKRMHSNDTEPNPNAMETT